MGDIINAVNQTFGAESPQDVANKAISAQERAAADQSALQRQMFEYQKGLFTPYAGLGQAAVDAIRNNTQIAGVTDTGDPLPESWDKTMGNAPTYADTMKGRTWDETMGGYDPAVAVERERTLGLRDLNNKYASRGIRGANMANKLADYNDQKNADLSNRQLAFNQQRYNARLGEGNTMYGNSRNELLQRRAGLLEDYNLGQSRSQDRWNKLSQMVGWGMGAQNNAGQAGNQYSQQAQNTSQNLANNQSNSMLMANQMKTQQMNGVGNALGQGLSAAAKNWNWGSGNSGWDNSSAGGYVDGAYGSGYGVDGATPGASDSFDWGSE